MGRRALCLIIATGCVVAGCKRPPAGPAPPPPTKPLATTAPATAMPAPPAPAAPPADVLTTIRLDRPDYPTKRPLDVPADLADAAKIVLDRPAYVDPQGNLWLTHPDGRPIRDVLAGRIADHTAVVRERVVYVHWPADGGSPVAVIRPPASASDSALQFVGARDGRSMMPGPTAECDFSRAVPFAGGMLVPQADGVVTFAAAATATRRFRFVELNPLENPGTPSRPRSPHTAVVLAQAGDTLYAWAAWDNGVAGSESVRRLRADGGIDVLGPEQGWPSRVIEVVPLVDGSVLTLAAGDAGPALKLIAAADKPPGGDFIRAVQPLARKLADRDPAVRQAAQRQLESQGPAVLPVLEAMREQLPPEARMRIETMLGQRFAPTLGGLRPLPGRVRTLGRFPGGGGVLRLDGGGTIDPDGDTPARSVIPATVLIRPGYPIELIDPESVTDFLPNRQSIQWVGEELLVSDPVVGPRRWVGQTLLKPILPKELADFDTVLAIDARRRWLLTSAKRPGKTLLIDPTLPDTTPKLPTWTVVGDGGVGRTDAGWPAVRRGDRVFVLERDGWRVDKPSAMREPVKPLAITVDKAGRYFSIDHGVVHGTDVDGHDVTAAFEGDAEAAAPFTSPGRLLVYTPDGNVRRYACGNDPLTIKPEATFTSGVPRDAVAWIDPAGRLIMASGTALTVAFPEGRIPPELADLMLNVGR